MLQCTDYSLLTDSMKGHYDMLFVTPTFDTTSLLDKDRQWLRAEGNY